MRLPKWLWRVVRSKRLHRFLAIAPFVAVVGVTIFYWRINTWGQAKIDTTFAQLRKMNIPVQPDLPMPGNGDSDAQKQAFREALQVVHPSKVFREAGLKPRIWQAYMAGAAPTPLVDLQSAMTKPNPDLTQELLAKGVVSELQTNRRKVEELMAEWGTLNPEQSSKEAKYSAPIAGFCGDFLLFHSLLLAESGDFDGAVRDFQLAFRLLHSWQHPTPYWRHIDEKVLPRALKAVPLLIENLRESPAHIRELDTALASMDSVLRYLQAEERRLHRLCEVYAEDDGITNQRIFVGLSDLTWGDGWGKQRATLADWWWQAKPIGYRKANLAKDIESLLPILRGLPEASDPPVFTFADLESYRFHVDSRNTAFGDVWSDSWETWTYVQDGLGLCMSRLLNLRLHRLTIAAELHRHRTGAYHETIEQLMPKPLISPFDGEPIQIHHLPDGRMQFEAVGATLLPDGTLHFDPTTPITFEYPPKP